MYIAYLENPALHTNSHHSHAGIGETESEARNNAQYWPNQEPWVQIEPYDDAPRWAQIEAVTTREHELRYLVELGFDIKGYPRIATEAEMAEYSNLLNQHLVSVSETYVARDEGGVEEKLEASSMEEALELARDWALDGDYGTVTQTIHGQVWVTGPDEDQDSISWQIDPDEPKCDANEDGHDWQRDEHGCSENPGVFGIGGAAVAICETCSICGLQRRTVVGDVDFPSRNGICYTWKWKE